MGSRVSGFRGLGFWGTSGDLARKQQCSEEPRGRHGRRAIAPLCRILPGDSGRKVEGEVFRM